MTFPGSLLWIWGLVAAGAVLAFVLIAAARQRPTRGRRWFVGTCSVLAVAALVLLGLEPRWRVERAAGAALLITPGAAAEQAEALADSLGAPVFALPGAPLPEDARRVPDVAFLARNRLDIGTLHVTGYGLPAYALGALRRFAVRLHLSELPEGVRTVTAPRTATVGQPWRVQGRLRSEEEGVLFLDGPAGPVDSARVAAGEAAFSLRDVPRAEGRFRYALTQLGAAGDTLAQETLGVAVQPAAPLRVLVVQGAPQFETRYLKNWLARRGGALAVRSAVSRDRFTTEFLNRPETDLRRLTPGVLQAFDVALLDARALGGLDAAERQALRAAVTEEGLGVLLAPGAARSSAARDLWDLSLRTRTLGAEPRRARLAWPATPDSLAPPVPLASDVLTVGFGGQVLTRDDAGRAAAMVERHGTGRVGTHLALATYQWVLGGHEATHAAYWSHLLEALAGSAAGEAWQLEAEGPVFAGQPIALAAVTPRAEPMGLVAGTPSDTLYLAQGVRAPRRWHGTYWPRAAGWHEVSFAAGEEAPAAPLSFYVHAPGAWTSWQAARRREALRSAYTLSTTEERRAGAGEREAAYAATEALPRLWFFLAFLFGAAGLWVERRW